MSFGWSGQILRVDLSKGESSTEDTEPYTRSFIGGRGINVKIIYDEVGPEISPFDPANRLCFGPGPLGGTLAPTCSRMKVTTMSPNGLIINSGIGGYIAAEIRHAGYDNIVIQGRADKPVYLYISDDSVEIRDASHIWGKDTWEAQQVIKKELGNSVQTMCIGPAGEKLVSFGSIITGRQSSAGRGGMGTIMGSKNLKAIAVRGTREIKIAKPEEFIAACEETHKWLREHPAAKALTDKVNYWDAGYTGAKLQIGQFGLGNWEADVNFDDESKRFKDATEFFKQYAVHQYECFGCPIGHSVLFNVPGIGIGSCDCTRWISFVSTIWNPDPKLTFHAAFLCDRYGLDAVSTANIISFLMELYHKGIITAKDTDGIAMKRGDEKAIISTIHKIGKQEGFGKLFKNGVLEAARTIGKGAEDCAMQVKGIEMYPLEVRVDKAMALENAIAHRDGVEENSWMPGAYLADKENMEKWATDLYGFGPKELKEALFPTSYEKKPLMSWDFGNRHCAADLVGACRNAFTWVVTPRLEIPAKLFSLATGRDLTEDELLFSAQRVKTLERAFLVIKGIRRKDDTLPKRLFGMEMPGGLFKGEKIDRQKFNKMIDEYYQLRGWDEDGIPTEETFNKFGLSSELKVFKKRLPKQGTSHS